MRTAKHTVQPAEAAGSIPSGLLAAGLIAAAVVLAYGNTLNAPFIFDDGPGIEDNESIRKLWPLGPVLHPPTDTGSGVAGRPIVNLTLAINHAVSGLNPGSYHAANILIHALAALTLFGLARRTLELAPCRSLLASDTKNPSAGESPASRLRQENAVPVAFGIALLWAVHPLQTESVSCVIQRTESLVGLFYLLTVYAFARAVSAASRESRVAWSAFSVATCALGMGTKEVMVTAPVMALLYDRTFVSGGFRGVLRHRWLHYGLFATWALLFHLMQGNPLRGGTAGYDDITVWQYLLTQCRAVVLYLKLALWPHPLVLDYGTATAHGLREVLPQALLLLALAGGTVYALWRRPVVGFLGAWFFVILAPSSSVVPLVTQTIAEHRVYLPLAAVLALAVGALAVRAARLVLPLCLGAGLVLGLLTVNRNRLYQSPEALWRDNLARQPDNYRVHSSLASVADKAGDFSKAVTHYEDYLRHKPDNHDIRFNLARDLVKVGRRSEALPHFEEILRARPVDAKVRINYGACLIALSRLPEAVQQFEMVLRMNGLDPENQFNLAEALAKAGRLAEALEHYQQAVTLKPEAAFMHYRHGDALLKAERPAEAAAAYRAAVTLQPDLFAAWVNLGGCLLLLERAEEAVPVYETALRLKPDDPASRKNLEYARSQLPR